MKTLLSTIYPSSIKIISVTILVLVIILAFLLNWLLAESGIASGSIYSLTLVIPPLAHTVLLFLPSAANYALRLWPNPIHQRLAQHTSEVLDYFLSDVIGLTPAEIEVSSRDNPFAIVEKFDLVYDTSNIHRAKTSGQRRKNVLIVLFYVFLARHYKQAFVKANTEGQLSARIQNTFRQLTTKGKEEFCNAQYQLETSQGVALDSLFEPPAGTTKEEAEKYCLQRHFKDLYLKIVFTSLERAEFKVARIKQAFTRVAESKTLTAAKLHAVIDDKKRLGKVFLIVSRPNLSNAVKAYITSHPHFILRTASITNLPEVGISDQFIIYLFSPPDGISRSARLFEVLTEIDPGIKHHAHKIYPIDTTLGLPTAFERDPVFKESIRFFEFHGFDPTVVSDELKYQQIVKQLSEQAIPIGDVLNGLAPGEFTASLTETERETFNTIAEQVLLNEDAGVLEMARCEASLRKAIRGADLTTLIDSYTRTECRDLFAGNRPTVREAKARLDRGVTEIMNAVPIFHELGF